MKRLSEYFLRIINWIILSVARIFITRDENYIAIGSWKGERFVDNSRYLMEYLDSNYPNFTLYWVGNDKIKDEVLSNTKNVKFLALNKITTNLKLLKCKYFFFSQFHTEDISYSNVYKGAVLCYLHHGMPIKKWGADGLNETAVYASKLRKIASYISGNNIPYDYFATSSPLHDKTNCTSLSFKGCSMEKNLKSGTPRNDMLVNYDVDFSEKQRTKYSELLNFDVNSKVIMYLPTFRRISKDIFSFSQLDTEQKRALDIILEKHNAVLIEKSHFAERVEINGTDSERIKFADKNVNVQEMMLFTDILISDYSGAFLDFILLDRPVLHFVYDYDYYKNVDSGLYYEIEDFSAGAVVGEYDSMLAEIDKLLCGNDEYSQKRKYVAEKFMSYEKGNSSEQIINKVIFQKDN